MRCLLALLAFFALADVAAAQTGDVNNPPGARQLPGTNTNDSANAGNLGEFQSNSQTVASLTSATAANVGALTLTAGDWDAWCLVSFSGATATVVNFLNADINTSVAVPGHGFGVRTDFPGNNGTLFNTNFSTGIVDVLVGPTRLSLATSTAYNCVAEAQFSVSTVAATGYFMARRAR